MSFYLGINVTGLNFKILTPRFGADQRFYIELANCAEPTLPKLAKTADFREGSKSLDNNGGWHL